MSGFLAKDANRPRAHSVQRQQFLLVDGQEIFDSRVTGVGECAESGRADPPRDLCHDHTIIRMIDNPGVASQPQACNW